MNWIGENLPGGKVKGFGPYGVGRAGGGGAVGGVPGARLQRRAEAGEEEGAGAAAVDPAPVSMQNGLGVDGEAEARVVARRRAGRPVGVELPAADAEHVEEDAVVGQVLDGALLAAGPSG